MSIHTEDLRDIANNHGWPVCELAADEIDDLERAYALLFEENARLRAAQERAEPVSPAVSEGWKLVPIEPTEDMLRAGRMWDNLNEGLNRDRGHAQASYAALLSATPPAPAQPAQAFEKMSYAEMEEMNAQLREQNISLDIECARLENEVAVLTGMLHHEVCEPQPAQPSPEPSKPAQTVPEDIIRYAKSMQKDGYRGPLAWASAIIDWVAEQGAARTRGDEVGK